MDVWGGELEVYKLSFPWNLKSVDCPVEGCPAKGKTPGSVREHFMFCHWKSKLSILQEGPEPLPRCDQCGMHMQATRLFTHRQSYKCHTLTKRQIRRRDVDMMVRCGEMEFSLDGEEGGNRVENVPNLRYLGRPLYQTDGD